MAALLLGTALEAAPPVTAKVVAERVPNAGIQPQVQVAGDGTVYLLYYTGDDHAGDVDLVRCTAEPSNFSEPIRVNSQSGSVVAVGSIRGAQLAVAGDGTVHVAWNGSQRAEPKGADGQLPLLYSRLRPDSSGFEKQRNLITKAFGLDGGCCIAADSAGYVQVAWHAGEGQEDSRRVWLVTSSDNGETFSHERPIDAERVGACGCCGMSGSVGADGASMFLYRSAREDVHRNMYLLTSSGNEFKSTKLHDWTVGTCPMSSAAFAHSGRHSWAAWETDEQVFLLDLQQPASNRSPLSPPRAPIKRKHPRLAVNDRDEVLLVWTEGTGWKRGGNLAWQLFDPHGRPVGEIGSASGVPVWSFAATYARPDGSFVILY